MFLEKDENSQNRIADVLASLNPSQRKAVQHTHGPCLVVAGAGSGKTRVLTARIANLIAQGVYPNKILALTFTNKAAREMRERIAHMVSPDLAGRVVAGTFHSIFARFLRAESHLLGYDSNFSIYDADDSLSLLKSIMIEMGISQTSYPPSSVRSAISNYKNKNIGPAEAAALGTSAFEKQVAFIYQDYNKKLKESNAMDFDDLLLNMIRVLTADGSVRLKYQNRFSHILVDEFQDTNKPQYEALRLLSSEPYNVCVVGDDAQSIYSWRGAEIRNILDFQADFNNVEVVRLEQNYRSTQRILDAADSVISFNADQIKKKLWTENDLGDAIQLIAARDDREEASQIISIISDSIVGGQSEPKNYAVLYRTNAQAQPLEAELRRKSIPHVVIGGISFYKRKEVKDILAYLRILVNPRDDESTHRAIEATSRGVGATSIRKLRDFAAEKGCSLLEAMERVESVASLAPKQRSHVSEFSIMIRLHTEMAINSLPSNVATAIYEASGLRKALIGDMSIEGQERARNIEQFIADIVAAEERYGGEAEQLSLSEYLQDAALQTSEDTVSQGDNVVSLMTIHSAKGLEFDTVFITGLEHGLFPSSRSADDPKSQEEERRLFYVAITRARKKLFLSYARERYRFGESEYTRPSKFLDEVGDVDVWGAKRQPESTKSTGARRAGPGRPKAIKEPNTGSGFYSDMPQAESYSQLPEHSTPLHKGSVVVHPSFGRGVVIDHSGAGQRAQVTVRFDSVGRKNLMLAFAKLEVLS